MSTFSMIASLGLAAALATGTAVAQDAPAPKENATQQLPPDGMTKDKAGKKAKGDDHAHAKVGSPAPAFTLKNTDGKDVSLSDFSGKTVVLQWINPDCPVCKGKMEDGSVAKMVADAKAADPDVVFLLVNSTHYMADKPASNAEYMKANNLALADDFKNTWAKAEQERKAFHSGQHKAPELREQIGRALYNRKRK